MLFTGDIEEIAEKQILEEYKEVLHRSKFEFSEDRVMAVLDMVTTGLNMERTPSGVSFPDADDAVFYEVALSKEGSYVVTGNQKHFPKSPIVVTPAEMLQIVQNS